MVKNYAEFIIRHKGLSVLLSIVAIMVMGFGAQFLTFTNADLSTIMATPSVG